MWQMDIKNVFKISPTGFLNSSQGANKTQELKLGSTSDRDGNGQTPYDQQTPKRQLSEQEVEQALEKLKNLAPVLEHKWKVDVTKDEEGRVTVFIKDNLGQLIKTIAQDDLASLLDSPDQNKGQLIKKSA